MPELMIDLCRVGNESIALVIYTSLTLLLLIACEQPGVRLLPITGVVLGLGLPTKAYFIAALPSLATAGAFALWRWPGERLRITLYVRGRTSVRVALVSNHPKRTSADVVGCASHISAFYWAQLPGAWSRA